MPILHAEALPSRPLTAIACRQAEHMQLFHHRHARFLRFIDTQQKWLLLHLTAHTCASAGLTRCETGAAANWIADRATDLGIASRNTALAFFGQLAAYGYIERRDCRADRRIKLVALSPETRRIMADWAATLVASLRPDDIDDAVGPDDFWPIYLDIAGAVLDSPDYLVPPPDVRQIQEMRGGWLVISHMLGHIDPNDVGFDRISLRDFNAPACARAFGLSRSTVYRLLRQAGDAGIMGSGAEAQIPFVWLSGNYLQKYCRWNGSLFSAAHAACGISAHSEATARKLPELRLGTASAIRAPAMSFF